MFKKYIIKNTKSQIGIAKSNPFVLKIKYRKVHKIIVITIFDKTRIVIFLFLFFKYTGTIISNANKLLEINNILDAYTAKFIIPFIFVNKEKIFSGKRNSIKESAISKRVQ